MTGLEVQIIGLTELGGALGLKRRKYTFYLSRYPEAVRLAGKPGYPSHNQIMDQAMSGKKAKYLRN